MKKPYCVDANAFITSWNVSYPKYIFKTLWQRISDKKESLIFIEPIYKEIKEGSELFSWIQEKGFYKEAIDSKTEANAMQLAKKYEIDHERKSHGANRNDILLISYAKLHNKTVVTLESEQKQKPKIKSNYKIPLICKEENVKCINFVELLKELEIVI